MSKTPITWIELLKEKIGLKGKGTSIGDVAPEAKKEWVQIKEGKHPKYTQGKMVKFSNKKNTSKKNKTKKEKKMSASLVKTLLSNNKICDKCKKEIKRVMKNQMGGGECSGGTDAADLAAESNTSPADVSAETTTSTDDKMMGGNCGCSMNGGDGCSCGMNGGKKGRKTKKAKKSRKN
jgi:hypothetical protein